MGTCIGKVVSICVPRPAAVIHVNEELRPDGTRLTTRNKVTSHGRQKITQSVVADSRAPAKPQHIPIQPVLAPGETQVVETVYGDGSKLTRTIFANRDGSLTVTETRTEADPPSTANLTQEHAPTVVPAAFVPSAPLEEDETKVPIVSAQVIPQATPY